MGLELERKINSSHSCRGIWSFVGDLIQKFCRETEKKTNTWPTPALDRQVEEGWIYKRREVSPGTSPVCAIGWFKRQFQKRSVHIASSWCSRCARDQREQLTEDYWWDSARCKNSFGAVMICMSNWSVLKDKKRKKNWGKEESNIDSP